ncbi:aspartate/glutamate racemase family protein [Nisaea sp.]|uniref:aspartate/glutamate racemase family protein n=1 Tax=Nisaea sp. TaxID=2024842 RepID=UPI003B518C96
MKHIGIVGCSAEGAALCYRTICSEAAERLGAHVHPEISMHTPSLSRYVACLEKGDLEGVAELMLDSARRLERVGADFLICPDNTIHQAFSLLAGRSPLPWLHIADAVTAAAVENGYAKLGITGTRWLVESDIYPEKLDAEGIAWLRPSPDEIAESARIILDELVPGIIRPSSVAYFRDVIEGFKSAGCDAVILGCTEIPLIISDANCALPTLDSTRLLARAALDTACT